MNDNKPIAAKSREGRRGRAKSQQDDGAGGSGLILAASEVSHNDVLFGRGCSQSPGNVAFRQLVAEKGGEYRLTKRDMKNAFAERLIDEIASRGGRFLVPVKKGKCQLGAKSNALGLDGGSTTTGASSLEGTAKGKGADFWMVAPHDTVTEKVKQGLRDFVASEEKKGDNGSTTTSKSNTCTSRKKRRHSDDSRPAVSSSSSSVFVPPSSSPTAASVSSTPTMSFRRNSVTFDPSGIPVVSSSSSSVVSSRTTAETTTTTTSNGNTTYSVAPPGVTAAMLASQSFHDFLSTIALPRESAQQSMCTHGVAPPTSSSTNVSTVSNGSTFPIANSSRAMIPGIAFADPSMMHHAVPAGGSATASAAASATSIVAGGNQPPIAFANPSAEAAASSLSSIRPPRNLQATSGDTSSSAAALQIAPFSADPRMDVDLAAASTMSQHSSMQTSPSVPAQMPPVQRPPPRIDGDDDDFQRVLGWLQRKE